MGRLPSTDLPLLTTYLWWWRLGSAVRRGAGGALQRRMGPLPFDSSVTLIELVGALPSRVEIVDPITLMPVAADLAATWHLNVISAEPLAAALLLGAEILVATDNPNLARAAAEVGVPYRIDDGPHGAGRVGRKRP